MEDGKHKVGGVHAVSPLSDGSAETERSEPNTGEKLTPLRGIHISLEDDLHSLGSCFTQRILIPHFMHVAVLTVG
jgi:hypothetical protein